MLLALIVTNVLFCFTIAVLIYYMGKIYTELHELRKEFNMHFNDGLRDKLEFVIKLAKSQNRHGDLLKIASGKAMQHGAF